MHGNPNRELQNWILWKPKTLLYEQLLFWYNIGISKIQPNKRLPNGDSASLKTHFLAAHKHTCTHTHTLESMAQVSRPLLFKSNLEIVAVWFILLLWTSYLVPTLGHKLPGLDNEVNLAETSQDCREDRFHDNSQGFHSSGEDTLEWQFQWGYWRQTLQSSKPYLLYLTVVTILETDLTFIKGWGVIMVASYQCWQYWHDKM